MTATRPDTDTGTTPAEDPGDASADHTGPDDPQMAGTSAPATGRARWFLLLSLRPVLLYLASRAGMLLVATATSSDVHQSVSKSLTSWDRFWYLSIAQGGYVRHIPPGHGTPAQSNLGSSR